MIKPYSDYYRPTGTPQSVIDEWIAEHGISPITKMKKPKRKKTKEQTVRAVKKLLKKQGVISMDDYIALNPANIGLHEVINILRKNTNWTFGKTLQSSFKVTGERK